MPIFPPNVVVLDSQVNYYSYLVFIEWAVGGRSGQWTGMEEKNGEFGNLIIVIKNVLLEGNLFNFEGKFIIEMDISLFSLKKTPFFHNFYKKNHIFDENFDHGKLFHHEQLCFLREIFAILRGKFSFYRWIFLSVYVYGPWICHLKYQLLGQFKKQVCLKAPARVSFSVRVSFPTKQKIYFYFTSSFFLENDRKQTQSLFHFQA